MDEMIKYTACLVAFYFLISLMDLPDWMERFFRSGRSRRRLQKRINELEARVSRLENK